MSTAEEAEGVALAGRSSNETRGGGGDCAITSGEDAGGGIELDSISGGTVEGGGVDDDEADGTGSGSAGKSRGHN
jgi:hypothetical protein